ncbi:hypothetical protein EBZ80_21215 [bacterium]|nr:hypothetical protein [bacterium]
MTEIETRWTNEATRALVGRRIVKVQYLGKKDCENMGWDDSGIALILDNGNTVIVQQDDEGNGPGALLILSKTTEVILPTLYVGHVS